MYISDSIIHFRLDELRCISSIVSFFDEDVANRIDKVFAYHKFTLKESEKQPLQITLQEKNNYLKKFHFTKVLQPEFIFSDDEEIF